MNFLLNFRKEQKFELNKRNYINFVLFKSL